MLKTYSENFLETFHEVGLIGKFSEQLVEETVEHFWRNLCEDDWKNRRMISWKNSGKFPNRISSKILGWTFMNSFQLTPRHIVGIHCPLIFVVMITGFSFAGLLVTESLTKGTLKTACLKNKKEQAGSEKIKKRLYWGTNWENK